MYGKVYEKVIHEGVMYEKVIHVGVMYDKVIHVERTYPRNPRTHSLIQSRHNSFYWFSFYWETFVESTRNQTFPKWK